MDSTAFRRSPSGRLISTIHGQYAFVPAPLPPKIDCSAFLMDLSEAMHAVGNLCGISRRLANPYMIIRPLLRREALTSSSMEGTHASPDDLVLLEAGEENIDEAAREVLNYIRALDDAVSSLKKIPVSWRMMRDTHRILLSGLSKHRGANKRPGEFKVYQNFIGGRSIEEARFIPPPPEEARQAMGDLEVYINSESPMYPAIIDAALVHYQFETIHPFADGNGRVGRILIPLLLMQKGVLDIPILYISPFIEENKDEYIDLMFEISRYGAWAEWVKFFLKAIRESCSETISTIDRLLVLQTEYINRAHDVSRSGSPIKIANALFEKPVITIPDAASIANVTYPAAASAVMKLVEAGILREIPGGTQPKRFVASEVVMISAGYDRAGRQRPTDEPV
jgi:Fic family protein